MAKIKLNDITEKTELTCFGDLEVGDYFIQNTAAIWMKTDTFNVIVDEEIHKKIDRNAIQITNNNDYFRYGTFSTNSIVEKVKIDSIDYRRIK